MSKWKCEICGSEFNNFHAQGFDNKIYCPLCYFKKLSADLQVENFKLNDKLEKQRKEYQETYKDVREEIKDYKNQLKQRDEVINEAIKYVKENVYLEDNSYGEEWWEITDKDELLEILQKYKGDSK